MLVILVMMVMMVLPSNGEDSKAFKIPKLSPSNANPGSCPSPILGLQFTEELIVLCQNGALLPLSAQNQHILHTKRYKIEPSPSQTMGVRWCRLDW